MGMVGESEPDDELVFVDVPSDPCAELERWFAFAVRESKQPNWNTLMLATATSGGAPSVRPVLMKHYDPATGAVTFFTNYTSRKAREMEANKSVALAMHWDHLERVIRIEGTVQRASGAVSDAYFASRGRESQIGAWASEQSAMLDDWQTLIGRVIEVSMQYAGQDVPRPPHWGGYVVTPSAIEFWAGRKSRIHERLRYERQAGGGWTVRRLNP
jgi:pyridoxamine 5'-phosphate oxidase